MVNGVGKNFYLSLNKPGTKDSGAFNFEPFSNALNFLDKEIAEFKPKEFKDIK